MSTKLARSWFAIYFVFALTSLGLTQERIPRIINGEPTSEFEAVGIIGSINRGGFCTGTLISPFHVLTAAHCVEIIAPSDEATFEIGGQVYVASTIMVHPAYDSQNLTSDLAILELADPVLNVAPMELFRDVPVIGDELTLVGFGAGGDAQGNDGTFGTKLVSTTPIDDLTPDEIIWLFDDADEGNSAAGDSGGAALLEIDGLYYLAAIISSGTDPVSALGDVAFNMRVDAYVDWIDAAVGTFDPGEDPGDEEPPTEEPPTEEPPVEKPPAEEPPTETPPIEQPATEQPCKFESGSFFNWLPASAASRGEQFRRLPRRPPTRSLDRDGLRRDGLRRDGLRRDVARRVQTISNSRRDTIRSGGGRGLSSRSRRRSR